MSQDFTTRLQLQLREAALRQEQRGALGRRLAGLRYGMPAPAATAAVGLAVLLLAVLIAVGGLRWGHEEDIVSNPKVIDNVPLAENLGFMSSGFGSVWVADADRQVLLRVNPETRAVVAEIRTGGDSNAQGGDPIVNTGAGAVWAIARAPGADGGSRVLRIDPATNRITARATLPADQAPVVFDLQIVQGRPWVVTSAGAIELDPRSARPGRFVASRQPAGEPFPLWSILSPDGELWVLDRSSQLQRYSLASGERVATEPVPLPGAVGVIPTQMGAVYAGRDGVLARAGDDGKIIWQRRVGTMTTIPLVLGGTLWSHASDVARGRDRLVEIDLRSGEVRSSTGLPEFGITGMTDVDGDLWIATPQGKATIVRPADR
jgi:hypothetical protein